MSVNNKRVFYVKYLPNKIYTDILREVKVSVHIPVAAKLSPFFSNFANMAKRLDQLGTDGLVLFNRFYQPDIDLEELEIKPNVLLSTPQDLRLPLTWIGILYGRIRANLHKAGFADRDITIQRSVDIRYRYQVHELNVPFPPGV